MFSHLQPGFFVRPTSSCPSPNDSHSSQPDIKGIQIQLTGFLDKDTPAFCKELWNLCLSAQASPQGVPKELLEAKKRELLQEKVPTLLNSLAQGYFDHDDAEDAVANK